MPNAYPQELRERAVRAYESGEGTYVEVAERFSISVPALERWVARSRSTGSVAAFAKGGGCVSPVNMDLLLEVLRDRPDATSGELAREYNRRAPRNGRVHRSSILRALHRAGFVFKKNARGQQSKTAQTCMQRGWHFADGQPR